MLSYGLSFIAGIVATLSPCVLPALPMVVGGAALTHRHAPLLLALGLITSSTLIGFSIAAFAPVLGIDGSWIRIISAALLLLTGIVLSFTQVSHRIEGVFFPIVSGSGNALNRLRFQGLRGQFFVGCLLGGVWSPCAGPALGTAIGLAAQSGNRLSSFLMMLFFGFGFTLPLLVFAYSTQHFLQRNKTKITRVSQWARPIFGWVMILTALLILSGSDASIEAWSLRHLPSHWVMWIGSV